MYYLQMEYGNKVISIPFGNLKNIDNYTIRFENREKFLNHIFRVLNVNISTSDIGKVYLLLENKLGEEFDYEYCLPIKYSNNNFNFDSLKLAFTEYLQKNHNRIRMFDIIHVKLPYMMHFKDELSDITNEEIKMAVNAYFNGDSYKKMRVVYFAICGEVNIKVDKVNTDKELDVRDGLSKLESNEDDYVQYLIELSSRGEAERERALEELSMMDIADVISRLPRAYRGVLDGASDLSMVNPQDILEFEMLTGYGIESLREIVSKSLGRKR